MKIKKENLNNLIKNILFEISNEEKEKQSVEMKKAIGVLSHEKRYPNMPIRSAQVKYGSNPTIYFDDNDNQVSSKKSNLTKNLDSSEGVDPLLFRSIQDMIFNNAKRIKQLEDKFKNISNDLKVNVMNSKDNKKYIINLNKEIQDLALLYNPK